MALVAVTVCELEPVVSATVNSFPHKGLLASVSAESWANVSGSVVILDTHQPVKFWLNAVASKNILSIFVTLEVSQLPISWLKFDVRANIINIFSTLDVFQFPTSLLNEDSMNIPSIEITLDVSQFPMSPLNLVVWKNILIILVTLDVSQKLMFWLKELLLKKLDASESAVFIPIFVTNVVHKLTFPLAISPAIVESSTTV